MNKCPLCDNTGVMDTKRKPSRYLYNRNHKLVNVYCVLCAEDKNEVNRAVKVIEKRIKTLAKFAGLKGHTVKDAYAIRQLPGVIELVTAYMRILTLVWTV